MTITLFIFCSAFIAYDSLCALLEYIVIIFSPFLTLSPQCLYKYIPASGSIGAPASLATFAIVSFCIDCIFPVFCALKSYFFVSRCNFSGSGIFPPCASTIRIIAPYAAPVVRSLFAMLYPCPFFALPANSRSIPDIQRLFLTKSWGAQSEHFSVQITSLASSIEPIPFPIGWLPSVIIVFIFIFSSFPSSAKCLLRCFACFLFFTFVPGPIGISISRCVAPTLAFFAMIDASICPSASMLSGCSTLIILSSAGARFTAPPQIMNPPTSSIIFLSLFIGRLTGHSTSIVSAVPAGDVIALLLVFGTMHPAATSIGTTIIVVLFPGTPPIECMSTTGYLSNLSESPVCAIALVSSATSFMLIPRV